MPAWTAPQPIAFFPAVANFVGGKDTPRDLLERCLVRLEEFEPAVGAFVYHDFAAARAAARPVHRALRSGRPWSAIDGMPLGIKDIIETADMPTEQGSPLFVGWRTGRDAASVAALREAGAVILGRWGDDGVCRDRAARYAQSLGQRAHSRRIERKRPV